MSRMFVVKWLMLVINVTAIHGMVVTYEQHAQFPKLFHLDDYDDCLGPKDGLYCVGSFHVRSLKDRDSVYELMKEYSLDSKNFNRTLIHRGYCVSSRCSSLSYIRNATLCFERCVAHYAKRRSLRTMLTQFSYCRTHVQEYASKNISTSMETPHLLWLYAVLIILLLNLIGTIHDVITSDCKKNKILTSWSIPSNWMQLVGPYPTGDPRFAALLPIEAGRVIFLVLVMFVHSSFIHWALYVANPKHVEEMSHQLQMHWTATLLQNGFSMLQFLLVLSSFFMVKSLLGMNQIRYGVLPKVILKRIFRIVPVYVLVIGFAATWWPLMREGPIWQATVVAESQVCRRKFWANLLFLNNFFEPENHCLIQTWFLAVDLQLHILGCIITVCLARYKRLALPLLAVAFVANIVFTSYLAYIYEWKPMMFVSGPENVRNMYKNERSFYEFYTSPLSCIPSMLVGIFIAHLHHQLQESNFKIEDHKWLSHGSKLMIPLLLIWVASGELLKNFTSREFTAIYIALERPVPVLISALLIFAAGATKEEKRKVKSDETRGSNGYALKKQQPLTKGFSTSPLSWRIWYPLGRASLSVMMIHWCVNMMIRASSLQPITSSVLDLVTDTLATTIITYILAIPVTLLVEIPFTKLFSTIALQSK